MKVAELQNIDRIDWHEIKIQYKPKKNTCIHGRVVEVSGVVQISY